MAKPICHAILLFILLTSEVAHSCQCVTASVDDGMERSELVFGAVVTGARVKGERLEIEISDFAGIKGDSRPMRRLTTPVGSGSCGFVVSVPGKYVFFANSKGNIDSCGASRLLNDPSLGVLADRVILQWRERLPWKRKQSE